jgi:hypothetical protein
MATTQKAFPWWLAGGTEACPVCLQGYAYELELRCVDCDGPLCPQCVVRLSAVRVEVFCPECAAARRSS